MDKYSQYIIPALLFALILVRRIMRTIGFQKFSRNILIFRIVIFSFVSLLVLATTLLLHPLSLIADFFGALAGWGLAFLAMKNTVFENRNSKLFYKTPIWIGLTIFALFLARFGYRMALIFTTVQNAQSPDDFRTQIQSTRDPLTGGIFFVLAAFYIIYFVFLLKKGEHPIQEEVVAAE